MSRHTPFHVYSDDGFESAHATERAARAAASRGARRRRVTYRVVVAGGLGYTGHGQGTELATYAPKRTR